MTCQHCCGAEKIFDDKEARKNLKRYRRKGPRNTTKRLLKALDNINVSGNSLLDIGGGVGAIQQELLARGLASSTGVDASQSYINAAKELMKENHHEDRMSFTYGDFMDVHEGVDHHDLVTLEKVVCCYPHVKELINHSASKASKIYALVYPIDNWLSKFINKLGRIFLSLTKNPFRPYIHSEKMMHSLILENGFERTHHSTVFPWKVAVYKRI
jgi:predicted TPR repeat methyltransferase